MALSLSNWYPGSGMVLDCIDLGSGGFSVRFVWIISRCGRIGCGIGVLQQTACLVVGLVSLASLLSSFIVHQLVGLQTL